MANLKGPKSKGKLRLFAGEGFGSCLSPKILKTWPKVCRKGFEHGGKIRNYSFDKKQ